MTIPRSDYGRHLYSSPLTALLDLADRTLISGDTVAGCPVAAVAMAADDPDGVLRAAADAVFTRWRAALSSCLARAGHPDPDALAAMAVAGVEGAIVLCRARGNRTPFDHVSRALLA